MSLRIQFELESVAVQDLNVLCRALCLLNVRFLRQNPHTPTLRQAGIRYVSQPLGVERFKTIPQLMAAGGGDCDQLAPARAAELRVRGVAAWPEVIQITPNLYHVFVRYPSGRAEDISAHLGMEVPPKLMAAGQLVIRKHLERRLYGNKLDRRSPRDRRAFAAVYDRRRVRGASGAQATYAAGAAWPWWW